MAENAIIGASFADLCPLTVAAPLEPEPRVSRPALRPTTGAV
jgi:hypothetical protein